MNLAVEHEPISDQVRCASECLALVRREIHRVIVGQERLVDRLLIALLCNQHVLIEGLPGLAKTLSVTTLARMIQATFRRIQFTPDLLPADVIGTQIYNPRSGEFTVKHGPIFAQIILADEINRAPAKVQSALLEAMQERQVTIGNETFPLDDPFLVLATQNPIEQEGTYALPEAQVDRFMMKLVVSYPDKAQELEIVRRMARSHPAIGVDPVLSPQDVIRLRAMADSVFVDESLEEYMVNLVQATRYPERFHTDIGPVIRYGASPRATIFLVTASKAHALMDGRGYVTPDDVKSVAPDVLRHRIILTFEAQADEQTSESIVRQILSSVEVP
jgi:MoxR-like ATPase